MTFKRKIYQKLAEWKAESQGKTVLLIEGARRIGKSTIVEAFARNEYDSYILIDFAEAPKEIRDLFNDMTDLSYFFLQLQIHYHVDLTKRKSLIVFDEVQFCPKARQAIKALVKDGRYDYIETGSLISIRKNVKDILIPSEERRLSMYPMDFEEFCWALGDEATIPLLREVYDNGLALGEAAHRRLMRTFRLYMLVGGMPQAVSEFISSNNFKFVDHVKRDILQLYEDDFRKIDSSGLAAALFAAIPSQLSGHASCYQVSRVSPHLRRGDITELLFDMEQSKTVLPTYQSTDPNVGLSMHADKSSFKMFLSDTGLFVTHMFKDKAFTENIVYEKLLNDKLAVNLGYVYENVVAQSLVANGNALFYHTWPNKETRHNYEIDFLLSRGNKISPIEVKSSGYKAHTSLDEFSRKYSSRIAQRYLIYTKDFKQTPDVTYLPVYFAQFL